jgi:hypothetical protein
MWILNNDRIIIISFKEEKQKLKFQNKRKAKQNLVFAKDKLGGSRKLKLKSECFFTFQILVSFSQI